MHVRSLALLALFTVACSSSSEPSSPPPAAAAEEPTEPVDPAPAPAPPPAPVGDGHWDPSVGAADCAAAWGTSGEGLSACDLVKDHYVVVHKSKRNVALCDHGALVKSLRSGLGFAPVGTKEKQGDGKTPEGVFYIPRLVPDSEYYKAFLLSYPTKADALRGFSAGLVSAAERDAIVHAQDACTEPPQDTGLGGAVEIHGRGSSKDWTFGCVALDDSGIDALWSVLSVNDTIVVVP